MTIEPYQLTIYSRAGRCWVSPSVLTSGGFESLPGAFAVGEPSELATALAAAVAQIHAHVEHPMWTGDPFYVVAGAGSWEEFLDGLVAIQIMRTRTATRMDLAKRQEHMLVSVGPTQSFAADLSLDEVARVALDLLAGA